MVSGHPILCLHGNLYLSVTSMDIHVTGFMNGYNTEIKEMPSHKSVNSQNRIVPYNACHYKNN